MLARRERKTKGEYEGFQAVSDRKDKVGTFESIPRRLYVWSRTFLKTESGERRLKKRKIHTAYRRRETTQRLSKGYSDLDEMVEAKEDAKEVGCMYADRFTRNRREE